jgi:hypothetical protein
MCLGIRERGAAAGRSASKLRLYGLGGGRSGRGRIGRRSVVTSAIIFRHRASLVLCQVDQCHIASLIETQLTPRDWLPRCSGSLAPPGVRAASTRDVRSTELAGGSRPGALFATSAVAEKGPRFEAVIEAAARYPGVALQRVGARPIPATFRSSPYGPGGRDLAKGRLARHSARWSLQVWDLKAARTPARLLTRG